MRVAAGAVARKVIGDGVRIRGALVRIGGRVIDRLRGGTGAPFPTTPSGAPTPAHRRAVGRRHRRPAQARRLDRRDGGDRGRRRSPLGLGAPVYDKLDADPRQGDDEHQRGEGRRDRRGLRRCGDARKRERRRNARRRRGRTDLPLEQRRRRARRRLHRAGHRHPFAVKPHEFDPPSPRRTIDTSGRETEIATRGRHDPCVGIRAVPGGRGDGRLRFRPTTCCATARRPAADAPPRAVASPSAGRGAPLERAPGPGGAAPAVLGSRLSAVIPLANAVSLVGTWVQRVALGWLTWELTGSGAWLRPHRLRRPCSPAVIVGPIGGVIADRLPRLAVIRVAQTLLLFQALALFALTATGWNRHLGTLRHWRCSAARSSVSTSRRGWRSSPAWCRGPICPRR